MDDEFVIAYNTRTGQKQSIPAHWLDNPILGRDWSVAPSARAAAAEEIAPVVEVAPELDDLKLDDLKAYAEEHDISLEGVDKRQTETVLAAIKEALASNPNPPEPDVDVEPSTDPGEPGTPKEN